MTTLASHERAAYDAANATRVGLWVSAGFVCLCVAAIALKALWGYWLRDLTFGDTSNYFMEAFRWHQSRVVNIVWSPLYTAYYGSWLDVTPNAVLATFLHRLGLIIVSTALVTYLGLRTLPRILALALAVWWVAMPIHFDTLYEVHMFGMLPVLVMAVLAVSMGDKWRIPVTLGVALVSTVLVRNEYLVLVAVLIAAVLWQPLWRLVRRKSEVELNGRLGLPELGRYGVCVAIAAVIISLFYSISVLKGKDIEIASKPKHTLNMCQVYAFGYQQRHAEWTKSPWSECGSLMQEKFGQQQPSLEQMITSNPVETGKHFLWNLSLTRAGLEVLLTNATASDDNPDYAPVNKRATTPTVLLLISLVIVALGLRKIYKTDSPQTLAVRDLLQRTGPIIIGLLLVAVAVILTQRPRPSYLLGTGVLYVWVMLLCLDVLFPSFRKLSTLWMIALVTALGVWLIPTYQSQALPSQNGTLANLYQQFLPQAKELCTTRGSIFINEYTTDLGNYLCRPHWKHAGNLPPIIVASGVLPTESLASATSFVAALSAANITTAVVDPYLTQKNPGLKDCVELRNAFLAGGWEIASYSAVARPGCIAAYTRP